MEALPDDVVGEVEEESFEAGMRQNAMEFDAHDADKDRSLDFTEFCALIREREDGNHSVYDLEKRFKAMDTNQNGRIEMHEYLKFALRDALVRSVTRVLDLLKSWDDDGSGDISKKEFRRAIKALGFDCRNREVDAVFEEFDDDSSGRVDYKELNRKLREYAGLQVVGKHKLRRVAGGRKGAALGSSVKLDTSAGVSSRGVADELKKALRANAVRVIDLFRDWDEDGSGTVSKAEFFKIMPVLGVDAPKKVVSQVFDEFDEDGSGSIEYSELDKLLRPKATGRFGPPPEPGLVVLPVTRQRVHVSRPGEQPSTQDTTVWRRGLQPSWRTALDAEPRRGTQPWEPKARREAPARPLRKGYVRMSCALPPIDPPPPPPADEFDAAAAHVMEMEMDSALQRRLARLAHAGAMPDRRVVVAHAPGMRARVAEMGFSSSISLPDIKANWRRKPPTPSRAATDDWAVGLGAPRRTRAPAAPVAATGAAAHRANAGRVRVPIDGAATGDAGDEAAPPDAAAAAPAKQTANDAPSADAATVAAVAAATASAAYIAAVASAVGAPSAAAALPPLLTVATEPPAAAPTTAAAPATAPAAAPPPPRPFVDASRLVLHAICAANLPDADAKPGGGKPRGPSAIGSDAYVQFRLVSADGTTEVARAETTVQTNAVAPSWVGEQLTIALPRMRHGDAPPRLRVTILAKGFTNDDDDTLGEVEVELPLELSRLNGSQLEVPLQPIVAAHAGMTISFSHTAIPRRYSAKSAHDGNKVVSRWRSLHQKLPEAVSATKKKVAATKKVSASIEIDPRRVETVAIAMP